MGRVNDNLYIFSLNIVTDLIKSGLTIEEYCFVNGTSRIYDLKQAIKRIKPIFKENSQIIDDILKERSNDDLYANIKLISYKIINDKDFDVIDYYQYTRMNMNDFLKIVHNVIRDEKAKSRVHEKISKINRNLILYTNQYINKEAELESYTFINERVISREEKEKVFAYLDREGLNKPYNLFVYKQCLRKYAMGNLNLEEKALEKRK